MGRLNYMRVDGQPSTFQDLLPADQLEIDEANLDLYFSTMIERQNICYQKEFKQRPFPWTEDEIFREFKFCNVYRELDKNTRFEIDKVILNDGLTDIDRLFQVLFFRAFNNPEFFIFIKHQTNSIWNYIPKASEYNPDLMYMLMEKYRSLDKNPFTNSYVTNSKYCPGHTRDWCFAHMIIPHFKTNIEVTFKKLSEAKTGEEAALVLKDLPSTGWFMAHEYYVSLCYIKKYRGKSFFKFTEDDWTNVGPGASLGIRLIFPNLNTTKKQLDAIPILRNMSKSKLDELGGFRYYDRGEFSDEGQLTLHQIEFFLCEFGKYWRMKVGEGKTRQKYYPK